MKRARNIRVFNAEGASETRPWDEVEAAITKPSEFGEIDVWLGCELAWADLSAIAKRHGLHALQYGERGSAEAGVGILSREPIGKPLMRIGSRAVPGVRMRPLAIGRTCGIKVTAGHAPPKRTPVARAVYLARVRMVGGFVGADFNVSAAWMRRTSLRKYRGDGVLGILVPRRFQVSPIRTVDIRSDHAAVDVRVSLRNAPRLAAPRR